MLQPPGAEGEALAARQPSAAANRWCMIQVALLGLPHSQPGAKEEAPAEHQVLERGQVLLLQLHAHQLGGKAHVTALQVALNVRLQQHARPIPDKKSRRPKLNSLTASLTHAAAFHC
eukprot:377895-Pelagomonas_calceolata.AAC.3